MTMYCTACRKPYQPSRAMAPFAVGAIYPAGYTPGACECGSTRFAGAFSSADAVQATGLGGNGEANMMTQTEAQSSGARVIEMMRKIERLRSALELAEAALADIGDADREPGDDLAWCEARAAQDLPTVRAALAA